MRTIWKVLVAAAAFAFGALLLWEFWLKDVWEALALPRLHHYWYGIFFMLGALIFHLRGGDKRAKYFLFTVGLIWFWSDFPDFIDHFGWILASTTTVLLILVIIAMFWTNWGKVADKYLPKEKKKKKKQVGHSGRL